MMGKGFGVKGGSGTGNREKELEYSEVGEEGRRGRKGKERKKRESDTYMIT